LTSFDKALSQVFLQKTLDFLKLLSRLLAERLIPDTISSLWTLDLDFMIVRSMGWEGVRFLLGEDRGIFLEFRR